MHLQSSIALTSTVSNAFAMSLKNGHHQLLHNLTISWNSTGVTEQTTFQNLKINYDII